MLYAPAQKNSTSPAQEVSWHGTMHAPRVQIQRNQTTANTVAKKCVHPYAHRFSARRASFLCFLEFSEIFSPTQFFQIAPEKESEISVTASANQHSENCAEESGYL